MSWQKEFAHSIKSVEEASIFFDYSFPETNYPLFIPLNFAEKIKSAGPNSPLWKQFLPVEHEKSYISNQLGLYDPIGDKIHSKGGQVIHRYKNRILFTPTTVCPIACRYCFRKNELPVKDEIFTPDFDQTLKYLTENTEVNEVIFSGGDPLILSNEKIDYYLEAFSKIKTIKYIRFHTRTPIILPSRVDQGLVLILKKFSSLFHRLIVMIHVNHRDEIDPEVEKSLKSLIDSRIDLFSQTVLLKNINDNTKVLSDLFTKLIDLKISPYYLHHPDLVLGAMHFYLSLEEGRKIFAPLHNFLPGWAIPQYVIDIPGGEGKIPAFNPESFEFSGHLINRFGEEIKVELKSKDAH